MQVVLGGDEAIVLYDLLSRWIDGEGATPDDSCFEDASECAVLHELLARLEKDLAAPFEPDYLEIVAQARARLAARWDGKNLRD